MPDSLASQASLSGRSCTYPTRVWKQDGPPYAMNLGRTQTAAKSKRVWRKLIPPPLLQVDVQPWRVLVPRETRWLGN